MDPIIGSLPELSGELPRIDPAWLKILKAKKIEGQFGQFHLGLGKDLQAQTQLNILGLPVDTALKLGYDGSANINALAPVFGGQLNLNVNRDSNNAFRARLQYQRNFR